MANEKGITIVINAETAEAGARLQEFFARSGHGLSELAKGTEFLEEIGGRIAAAFSVGAMVEFTREAINAAEGLQRLSKETGFSVELLSALREMSANVSGGFEEITGNLGIFATKLGEAVRIGGSASLAFRELIGREALGEFAAGGKGIDAVLGEVIEAFSRMAEGPRKAALAVELFGRSGREVLPVLERMKADSEGAISPEMAADATRFNVALRQTRSALENLVVALAQGLLPALNEVAGKMKEWSEAGAKSEGVLELIEAAAGAVTLALEANVEIVGYWVASFEDAFTTVEDEFGHLLKDVASAIRAFMDLGNAGGAAGAVIARALRGDVRGAMTALGAMGVAVKRDLAEIGNAIGDATGGSVDRAGGFIQRQVARTMELQRTMAESFQRVLTGDFAGGMQRMASGLFGSADSGAGGAGGAGAMAGTEEKALIEEIDKAYAESVQGRVAALHQERDALMQKTNAILDGNKMEEERGKIMELYARKEIELNKQLADSENEIKLAEIEGRRKLLQSDPFRTEAEKKQELLAMLRMENTLLERNIELSKARVRDPGLTPEAHIAAVEQLNKQQQAHAELQQTIGTTAVQGTFGGEFKRTLTELGDAWGSWAKQIALTFKEVIGSAISSISSGITGLIMGTMTWGQALRNIGSNLLGVVVQGIVRMFAEWVIGTEATKTAELASQAATLPGALVKMLATAVGEGGWAAVALIAAAVAAMGVGIAYAAGAFEEGGYTGAGPRGEVAGVVHKGEFVFSAPAVNRIGRQNLESMHSGGGAGGSRAGGGGGGTNINMWVVNDESEIPSWTRSQQGEDHVVNIVRRNWHKLQS